MQAGDILLLLVPRDTGDDVAFWLGALPLANRGLAVTENSKVWLAIGIFTGAVAAASLGLIYLPIALGIVVIAYVLAKIVPLSELYTHIEWPVVVLLGSMIPLGAALEKSGGTELIAGALVSLTQGMPAWVVLTVLMVVTMTLSDVLNNTATTIVAAPVGIQMAQSMGVNADPFLMAVADRRLLGVPHPHRAQEQHAHPRPGRLRLRGLLAHRTAARDHHRRRLNPRHPRVLAALVGTGPHPHLAKNTPEVWRQSLHRAHRALPASPDQRNDHADDDRHRQVERHADLA